MENQPVNKIKGQERKKLNKEKAFLKSFIKNFWSMHQLDKDMCSFIKDDSYLISDEDAVKKLEEAKEKLKLIEQKLSEHE